MKNANKKKLDNDALFKEALEAIKLLEPGTVFEVKSLFEGYHWEELEVGVRTGFGRHFKSKFQSDAIPTVQYVGRAKNNHALYRKTE